MKSCAVRWGITAKLFAAMLACIALVLGVMLLAQRVGFQRGFLEYLSHQEVERAESLVNGLARFYSENGGWKSLRGDHRQWRRLLWEYRHYGANQHDDMQPDVLALAQRLTLLDLQHSIVVGNPHPAAEAVLSPIMVEGRTVGWLVISPYTTLTDTVDLQFEAQQLHTAWLGALLAVVLAGLTAVLLARWFVAPLRHVADASRRLGSGDYRARVTVSGRDELAQLGRDFNRLAATLEDNEHARRDFMADIAHELRTPLTVLRGELEALADGVRPLGPAALTSLQQEVATLTQLVEDLRQLALSDHGSLSYQFAPVDLALLVQDEVAAQRQSFDQSGLALEYSGPDRGVVLQGDVDRLRQLLRNLLANSQRYTDAPGRVVIDLQPVGRLLRLRIEDSAPAVAGESLPRLFERLYRVDASRNRSSGGSGLGLAIVQAIAMAHGGRVEAQLSALGGLAVEVTLPMKGEVA